MIINLPHLKELLPIKVGGPWPFITFRSYTLAGQHILWLSRQHRKGLNLAARALGDTQQPFWRSKFYNQTVGATFALGSFLFMLGCVMSLIPASPWQPSAFWTNVVFFAGSIPFTTAGYLQHFQAANAGSFNVATQPTAPPHISFIGWHPRNAGWLSTFTQFLGTIAFNFNTFDPLVTSANWVAQDLAVWTPGMVGSVLFLASGYLAFIECGHRYWSWEPKDLSWWIVFINLVGCVTFMVSSILAYVPDGATPSWVTMASTINLLIGALCFFIGALLSIRESDLT